MYKTTVFIGVRLCFFILATFLVLPLGLLGLPPGYGEDLGPDQARLAEAEANRGEIEEAVRRVPAAERAGLLFLIQHMPRPDLQSLSAEFLLENTRLAYRSRVSDPWAREIPEEIFFNDVLPYASVNERRDAWRGDFRERFLPLVAEARSTTEAAAILNQNIFRLLNVKYSTGRKKADQSPYESMETGLASCTGLSILLVDACRSVGVPARLVGTPLWSDGSGNHSWVEIWDQGWHFTGAAEPTGDQLNQGWFTSRAATARRDEPKHAIFATSFRPTPITFPCVWDRRVDYIPAINVTDRYTALQETLPEGYVHVRFVIRNQAGTRVAVPFCVTGDGQSVCIAKSKDESFDANDHVTIPLKLGAHYTILIGKSGPQDGAEEAEEEKVPLAVGHDQQLVTLVFQPKEPANLPAEPADTVLDSLRQYLAEPEAELSAIGEQAFARQPLSKEASLAAKQMLAAAWAERLREQSLRVLEAGVLREGDLEMPFFMKKFGDKPAAGWSLYISLHGGGGAPPEVNDRQWENQKQLYTLEEGIYLVPRAPTNTWDLWHQAHIDRFFERLIQALVIAEGVNANRVYIMGYSAGGDGVFQLAPRLADRWAAAAMMAGHPNETSPLGLRNVPFALQMGGKDSAYNRNGIAREWEKKLSELQAGDPNGYTHFVKIYPDKGHWMDREDRVAVGWMAQFTRNPVPQKILWKQDDVTRSRFYWVAVEPEQQKAGAFVSAAVQDQTVTVDAEGLTRLIVHLDDRFLDLDQPLKIVAAGKTVYQGTLSRSIAALASTLLAGGDEYLCFPASVSVELSQQP